MPGGRRAAGLLGAGRGGFFGPGTLLESAVECGVAGDVAGALGFSVAA